MRGRDLALRRGARRHDPEQAQRKELARRMDRRPGADLWGAELGHTALIDTNFTNARLDSARFYGAGMRATRFYGASLRGLHDLNYAHVDSIDVGPPGAPELLEYDDAVAWLEARVS